MPNLYVYGTLRNDDAVETFKVPALMYDMGWFPAAVSIINTEHPDAYPHCITVEKREISEEQLVKFDRYEGYNPDSPETSFYKRVQFRDGWIYQFNKSVEGYKRVYDGDWLSYIRKERK